MPTPRAAHAAGASLDVPGAASIPARPPAAGADGAGDDVRLALAAAGIGVWAWERGSDVLEWDATSRALLGLPGEGAATPAQCLARVHPEDREWVRAAARMSLDPGVAAPFDVVFRTTSLAGDERWVHAVGRAVWADDPPGAPRRARRFIGTLRDDTAARRAERALAERGERLRAALDASQTGTFRWDIRTNALAWDESLDRLFGLEPGETVRSLERFVAMVHPDDRARVIEACARCAREGADFHEEFRVVWPDGTVHWLDDKGRTFRDATGAPDYMTGACVEVTARRRAEQQQERLLQAHRWAATLAEQRLAALETTTDALRLSEARLRRILDSGIVGVFFWTIDGGVTDANDAFLALLDYTRDDLAAGRIDWRSLTPERWHADDAARVAELHATGRHGPYAKEYRARDGTPVPVLIASAFFDGSHEQGLALCLDRRTEVQALADLQARERELHAALADARHARDEAHRARRSAESANEAKSAFLATMSHELRTPLNAIGGYVDILELGIRGPLTPEQLADLTRIRRSQQHLLGLINDVLNFAKLGAGTIRYDLRDVPVAQALASAEIMIAPQVAAKGLHYTAHVGGAALAVHADAEKLQQVLLNLLSNAVKFTDRGGAITVECALDGDVVALRVRDTGCGIPAHRCAQVFEPFVQVDRHYSRPTEGVGLGLAISRELARGMHGDLTVESELHVGSTFTLTLPRGESA
ncbi:PAS domain-containing sensor histidine kinase [Roseisolibacter agri]|uniref:PAS domain-containing sensor histidine kinase n=1 Tax=Roseisolibacter agri TaxID=2014610 RepID=UPI0024E168E5|nr:PAS domain-containing protein [Roseisolibacter agri]